jgi:hypothetical protein
VLVGNLKRKYLSLKRAILKNPKLIIPTTALLFLCMFSLIELTRAGLYRNSAREYKDSAEVQSLHETVDKLQRSTEQLPAAFYCELDHENLLSEFNEAYSELDSENTVENLVRRVSNQTEELSPAPAFSSPLNFLPVVKGSSELSEEMEQALQVITELTEQDVRSDYCLKVEEVLTRVYFLESLATTEGVAALLPGQVENFQVNLRQAQEIFEEIQTVPKIFMSDHGNLAELLQNVGEDLRKNANKNEAFARRIQNDIKSVKSIITNIGDKTEDLQRRPQEIALQASYL